MTGARTPVAKAIQTALHAVNPASATAGHPLAQHQFRVLRRLHNPRGHHAANQRRRNPQPRNRTKYTYDSENRLRTAAVNGSATVTVTYDYDPLGRRHSKAVSGTTTTYLSDGNEEIAEYNGATLLRRYVTGPQVDDRIAMVEGATRTYFHVNHQGSVLAMTDAAGSTSGTGGIRLAYDAYGNSPVATPTSGVPFRYTGRRLDPETGLYFYRARYYAPQIGRFLQTDPFGNRPDLNVYAYVGNEPVNSLDPSGQAPPGCGTGSCPPPEAEPEPEELIVTSTAVMDPAAPSPTNIPAWTTGIAGPAVFVLGAIVFGGCGDSPDSPSCKHDGTMTAKGQEQKPSEKARASRPTNAPPGTKPIDSTGRTKEDIHRIKKGVGAGPRDWVGETPSGEIVTTNPDGTYEPHGQASDYTP